MPIPKYFVVEHHKSLKQREALLEKILAKLGPQEKDADKDEVKMSLEDAVRLIQIHERARQGRLRAKFMRIIRQQEERERLAANRGAPTLDPDIAATRIQKVICANAFSMTRVSEQVSLEMYSVLGPWQL